MKIVIPILITFTFLFVLFSNSDEIHAISLNLPQITKISQIDSEKGALKIEYTSNNTGTDYSIEILNTALNSVNTIAGSSKYFVFQNLEEGKEYGIMIRACKQDSYSCTNWTEIKKTTLIEAAKKVISNNNNNNNTVGNTPSTPQKPKTTVTTQKQKKTTTTKTTKQKQKAKKPVASTKDKKNTGKPTCTLVYNSTNDKLTFKTTTNAVKYSIVKNGKKPKYQNSKVTYYPGTDRMNNKSDNVSIKYKGYVKNKKGTVGTCTITAKVSRGAAAVSYAKKFKGTKYCSWWKRKPKYWHGGNNLKCTDCSGFTGGIYSHFGKSITTDDDKQCRASSSKTYKVSGKNSVKNAKIGDIVCFAKKGNVKHVALYMGEKSGKRIKVIQMGGGHGKVNIDTKKTWYKIVRVK